MDDRDSDLLSRIAAGDMVSMRALYMAHAEAVRRFVRTRTGDEFEAADIVHDTMLAVWRSAASFDGRSSVRSWILTLARNKAVDLVRKQSRVSLAEPDETIPDDDPDPETIVSAAEDAARVRACVAELPDHHRVVVHLAFFEDLTYAQIATVENVPEGTIKTRIFHAKRLLMHCLSRTGKILNP